MAGKGGVGRSTVAAALAERSVRLGRRVIAIDAVGSGGLSTACVGAGIDRRFDIVTLTTRASLDEYLRLYLRFPISPSRLKPLARLFDYVATAAPGVREILVIGKIGHEVRSGVWDDVVVDAPATGHVVELLTAPDALATMVPTGPLAEQTGWLREIVASEQTGVVLVTVPEDLALTEAEELAARIDTETTTSISTVIVNRMPAAVDPAGMAIADHLVATDSILGPTASLVVARHRAAAGHAERMAALDGDPVRVEERISNPVGAVIDALSAVDGVEGRAS